LVSARKQLGDLGEVGEEEFEGGEHSDDEIGVKEEDIKLEFDRARSLHENMQEMYKVQTNPLYPGQIFCIDPVYTNINEESGEESEGGNDCSELDDEEEAEFIRKLRDLQVKFEASKGPKQRVEQSMQQHDLHIRQDSEISFKKRRLQEELQSTKLEFCKRRLQKLQNLTTDEKDNFSYLFNGLLRVKDEEDNDPIEMVSQNVPKTLEKQKNKILKRRETNIPDNVKLIHPAHDNFNLVFNIMLGIKKSIDSTLDIPMIDLSDKDYRIKCSYQIAPFTTDPKDMIKSCIFYDYAP